jgi:hypothetical protein
MFNEANSVENFIRDLLAGVPKMALVSRGILVGANFTDSTRTGSYSKAQSG